RNLGMGYASAGACRIVHPLKIMTFRVFIWSCLVLWSACSSAGAAEAAATPDSKYLQPELAKQQQIKATTSRVGVQLESIIAEFERNGINGEDVKVLRAIRTVLDKLSEKDMTRVLEFLQQSRAATNSTAAAQSATEAYAGQKTIVVQLQQL